MLHLPENTPNRGYFFDEVNPFYEPFGLIGGIFLMISSSKKRCVREKSPIGGIFFTDLPAKYPHRGYFFDGRTALRADLCASYARTGRSPVLRTCIMRASA